MISWPPGIFVVGTDTGVGKTRVAAAIARTWVQDGHRVGVVKPVSTGGFVRGGSLASHDVDALSAAIATAGSPFPPPPPDRVGPLIFEAPLAPPFAARRAGAVLDPTDVVQAVEASLGWWAEVGQAELVVIEGVGGLLCPLAAGAWTVADLAIHLDYPILIVAHRGLGTLNHTLMTVEVARSRGLRIAGVVLNATRPTADPLAEQSNAGALATLLPTTAILADWEYDPNSDRVPVAPEAGHWVNLARVPRREPHAGRPIAAKTNPLLGAANVLDSSDDDLITNQGLGGLVGSTTTSSTMPGDQDFTSSLRGVSPATGLAGLDFSPRPATRSVSNRVDQATSGDEIEMAAPPAWRNLLLTSYASAVTLALLWSYYHNRGAVPSVAPSVVPMAKDQFPDGGRLGDRSKRVEVLRPIPADHVVAFGQTRHFDSLEIEPIAIERKNLVLQRVNLAGKTERRDGAKRAVQLRIRLMNRSSNQVFAPVDPAFVRVRSDGLTETLLELDDGRKVYPDPLAVESEWAVLGESFGDLRPGESREVIFATEANAPSDVERLPGTWRIKLRTGLNSTAEIGVRLPGKSKP